MQRRLKEMTGRDQERRIAKNVNFGLGYGMGIEKFARTYLGGVTRETLALAQACKDAFFGTYLYVKPMHQRFLDTVKRCGYITLINGQRIHFNMAKEHYSDVLNAPIQGSAAVVMKHAFINMMRVFRHRGWLYSHARIVSTVHDEAIVELRKDIAEEANDIIRGCFEQTTTQLNCSVPLLADPMLGTNWLEAHA